MTRVFRLTLFGVGVMLPGCRDAEPPSPPPPDPAPQVGATSEGPSPVARTPTVRRGGDTLWIRTERDDSIALIDRHGEMPVRYRYEQFRADIRQNVVRVDFFEGGTYALISDRTGDQVDVLSPPVVSPDGRRFATASVDLEAGHDPNGIEIWELTPHGPRLQWRLLGGSSWGASEVQWVSPTELVFQRHSVPSGGAAPVTEAMRLTIEGNGIVVEPAAGAALAGQP